MSKPNRKRYHLEEILQKREEAVGGRDIEFEWAGKTYTFPHPMFAPDEWQEKLTAAATPRQLGVAVLGEGEYDAYHADGGQASFLNALIEKVRDDATDTTPDGTPTRSSTS